MLLLSSQEGSTRPLLAELQQTSLLLSGPVLSHRTRGPDRPAPGSSLLPAQSGQALPRCLCGEAAQPVSSAECAYPPAFTHTHTHTPRVACWLLSAGDGSRGDTALPRPQPVGEPHPALPALRRPLPSKPHSQPGQPSKSPWQQLPEFFWSLRRPSLLEWKPSVTAC